MVGAGSHGARQGNNKQTQSLVGAMHRRHAYYANNRVGRVGIVCFVLCQPPPLFILSCTSDDLEEGRLAQPCIKQWILTVETHAS